LHRQRAHFIQRSLLKELLCRLQKVSNGKNGVLASCQVLLVGKLVDGLDAVGDATW
jgi:hypothetical protein